MHSIISHDPVASKSDVWIRSAKEAACYHGGMMRDDVPFGVVWKNARESGVVEKAALSLIDFLEHKFGAQFMFERDQMPFGQEDLMDLGPIIEELRDANVVRSMEKWRTPPDEPRLIEWHIRYGERPNNVAVGASVSDTRLAAAKAVAEAVERAVWSASSDYFVRPRVAQTAQIRAQGPALVPALFAGAHGTAVREDAVFLWVDARSLIDGRVRALPAQTISGAREWRSYHIDSEPLIRSRITTGLATHPSREEALLGGLYETIERDAYMIWWLNQLRMPRYDADAAAGRSANLERLIETCRRYRLEPHLLVLPTDAPVIALAVMLEDHSGRAPRFSVGTAAHHDFSKAAEKALTEALRARRGARIRVESSRDDSHDGHYGRLAYWADPSRASLLERLLGGDTAPLPSQSEASASIRLAAIVAWLRARGYECVSAPLTRAALNRTPWHIEMVVVPELQPMHYDDQRSVHVSTRVREVPEALGYRAAKTPYTEHPHPFA